MVKQYLDVSLKLLCAIFISVLSVACASCSVRTEDTELNAEKTDENIVSLESEGKEYEKNETKETAGEEILDNNSVLLVGAQIEIKDEEDKVLITKEHIASSKLREDNEKFYRIDVKLTPEGKRIFAEATEANIGKRIEIWFDGKICSAPIVQMAISSGEFYISDIEFEEAQEISDRFAVHNRDGYISNDDIINYGRFWPDGYNYSLERGDNWESYLQKYKNAGCVYNEEDGEWVENDGTKFKVDGLYVSDAFVIRQPRDYFYIGRDGKKSGLGVEWYDFSWDRSLRLANAYPGTTNVRELNQANCFNGDLCLAIGYSQFLEMFGESQFEVSAELNRRDKPTEGHEFIEYLELTHKESGISARLRNYYTKEETVSKCSYCVAINLEKLDSAIYNAITLLEPYAEQDTIIRAIEAVNYGKDDETKVQFDGYYDIMTAYVRGRTIYIYNETWESHEWNSGFSFS